MPRYDTFREALIQLNRNISRTRLADSPGIVEVRSNRETITIAESVQSIRLPSDYSVYPKWASSSGSWVQQDNLSGTTYSITGSR